MCAMTDGWSLTHLLFYGFLGMAFPDHFIISMVMSVAWEVFEHLLGRVTWFTYLIERANTDSRHPFWYGKPSDILVNAIGFLGGAQLGHWLF
jgi:hypothetical protein